MESSVFVLRGQCDFGRTRGEGPSPLESVYIRKESRFKERKRPGRNEEAVTGDPFKETETSTPPVISDSVRCKSLVIGITGR